MPVTFYSFSYYILTTTLQPIPTSPVRGVHICASSSMLPRHSRHVRVRVFDRRGKSEQARDCEWHFSMVQHAHCSNVTVGASPTSWYVSISVSGVIILFNSLPHNRQPWKSRFQPETALRALFRGQHTPLASKVCLHFCLGLALPFDTVILQRAQLFLWV